MASNYTSNYQLCLWEPDDKVLRTEFNADNRKIDAALAGKASASALSSLQSTVNGLSTSKADVSALESLKTTVNSLKTSKADKTALDSLKTTVTQQAATLAGKGNCQIFLSTYTGKGTYGEENQNSITFPSKPEIIFITAPIGVQAVLIQGQDSTYSSNGGSGSPLKLTWSGNSVKWYNHMSATGQLNSANTTYTAIALARAD